MIYDLHQIPEWKPAVISLDDVTNPTINEGRYVIKTGEVWVWNGLTWILYSAPTSFF